jgi:hypothetical protein
MIEELPGDEAGIVTLLEHATSRCDHTPGFEQVVIWVLIKSKPEDSCIRRLLARRAIIHQLLTPPSRWCFIRQ